MKLNNTRKEISSIYRINKFLSSIGNLEHLLNLIMEEATKAVKAEVSSIALYDKLKKDLYFTVALGKQGMQVKQFRIKLGEGIIGLAAKSGKCLNIKDVTKDKRFFSKIDLKTGFKTKSILAVPIIHKQKLIGALEVINKIGGKCFLSGDRKLLEIIAGQAAIAIENAMLYHKLSRKHHALKIKHRQLIEAQEKLVTMEKLSAIGNMASRIVHDFRNPLTIIKGFANMLKKDTVGSKEREEFSSIIINDVDRLMGMTVEILEFARGKINLSFEETSLKDFMEGACSYLKRDFENSNIKLTCKLNYTGPVYMDKHKIERVIFNIASNAKDAMLQGGDFKIEATSCGEEIEFKLSDTGSGIPGEIKDKIFEPFATFGKKHGTGLGLAIVKKIIAEHGGTVEIKSPAPKKGSFNTTFVIRFPYKRK